MLLFGREMTHIAFDTDKLDELGDNLDAAALKIDNDLMRLDLELLKLSASWTGEAQLAYEQAQSRWTESMRELQRIIVAASQVCDFAIDTYETTEDSIEQKFA